MNKTSNSIWRARLFLIVAVLCFVIVDAAKSDEPAYGGKALSEWLLELHRRPSPEDIAAETQKPQQFNSDAIEKIYENKKKRDEDAIRQIGKNALPTLLEMLGATSETVSNVVRKLQAKEFREPWWSEESRGEDLRSLAMDGFTILGTNAESAVPQLTKLFHDSKTSFDAGRSLTRVGPKGVSVLTNALNNPKDPSRSAAIWWLREAPLDDKTKDGLLIQRLNDEDQINRHNAAQFLAGKDPAAIPTLIKMLDEDTNYLAVSGAADGLAKFGPAAKDAVPKLFSIYTNHVVGRDRHEAQSWAFSVMSALKAIDSDAAARAEAFLVSSGPLTGARSSHTTTLLTNGWELIVGGYIHTEIPVVSNQILSSVQLNNPVSGKWSETGSLKTPRFSHTATLLRDGRVLVAAGSDSNGHALASAELYDPGTGKWTETGSLNVARNSHTAALQADGQVMIAGGHTGSDRIYDTEYYDPTNGKWTAGPLITNLVPAARQKHTATLLADRRVLVAGGSWIGGTWLSTAELYDPVSREWKKTGALKTGRFGHTAILLSDGKVLTLGGSCYSGSATANAELYDPAIGEWKTSKMVTTNDCEYSAILLTNGNVLITECAEGNSKNVRAMLYDPVADSAKVTGALSIVPDVAALLPTGKALVIGFEDHAFSFLFAAQIYDSTTEKWKATRKRENPASGYCTITRLRAGKFLIAGGSYNHVEPVVDAFLYDPATDRWLETGALNFARYGHTATLLPDGKVLVAGSFDGDVAVSTAELFDPTTGKWTVSHRLNAERFGHTATLLPNGKVLIVGGDAVNRTELYDPAAEK